MSRAIFRRIIIALLILMAQTVYGQENNIEKEIEQGILNFQNAQFEQALLHLEPIVQIIPENYCWNDRAILIFICESSAIAIEDFEKVILYGEKLKKINDLPIEYKIQNLNYLLGAYDALAQETKCISTIDQLKNIFTSYKSINILDAITLYYLLHKNYTEIICFEEDLKLINSDQNKGELDDITDKIAWNSVYMGLAQSFMQLEDYHKAITYLEKSLDTIIPAIEDNRSGIYQSLSRAYLELGDKKTALKYQKLAIESE